MQIKQFIFRLEDFPALPSISLENLNQVSDTPDQFQYYYQPSVQTQDGVTQTEGIHDDNLTLLEYINKYCSDSKNVSSTTESSVAKCEELKLPVTSEAEKPPPLSDVLKPIEPRKRSTTDKQKTNGSASSSAELKKKEKESNRLQLELTQEREKFNQMMQKFQNIQNQLLEERQVR